MAIAFVAAWAAKQQNHGGSTLALTAINSTGANFIAVNIECDVTLSATVPVSDNFGNTYQKAYGPDNFTSGDKGYLYYAENPTVGASHVITITATGTAFIAAGGACYSGLATSSTLDQVVAIATGSGSTLTSGTSGATDTANELVIMTGSQDTGSSVTWGGGTGFNLRNSIGNASAGAITFLEDKIVTSTGTQQGTATSTVSANWGCALATFRAAGAGGGVTVSPPVGSLTLSGNVPTVAVTQNQLVKPPAGSLVLTGLVPTVKATANQKVLAPAGALTLTGFAPTVVIGSNVIVAPPAGSLSLTGFAPTVKVSANQRVSPPAGSVTLTALVPTVKVTQNILVHAPLATLALTGLPPSVIGSGVIPAAPTGPTPAGRKRNRYYVEVDGVQFDVDDSEQARAILERAKTLAKEAAEQSALIIERTHRLTTETIAPVKLSAPRIKASPELRLPLKSVRRSINKIYREKSVILELRMWLELEQRLMEDDEEAMLLLN